MAISNLPGIYLSGSSLQLSFSLLLSIPLSGFLDKIYDFIWYSVHIIIILLIWEFFTPKLADDFPLETEWEQVSSSFQISSQYSVQSQQCYRLDGLHWSSNFLVLQFIYRSWVTVSSMSVIITVTVTFIFHRLSSSLASLGTNPFFLFPMHV